MAKFAQRKLVNRVVIALAMAAMAFGLFWLFWILIETARQGHGWPVHGDAVPDDAAARTTRAAWPTRSTARS